MQNFTPRHATESERDGRLEINFETILLRLIKNWWLLLIGTLIASMLIYVAVTETYKQQYSSEASFVVAEKGTLKGDMLSNIQNTQSMAAAFARVIESDVMREKIKAETGIDTEGTRITTSQLPETNVITLKVTSASPAAAFNVINAIIENHHLVTDTVVANATVTVLKSPGIAKSPDSPLNRRNSVLKYTAAAFAALVAAVVIKTVFSNKIYTERDFENKVGELEKLATLEHERVKRRRLRGSIAGARRYRAGRLLVNNPMTGFGYSETMRLVQTRLEYLMKDAGARTLLVSSVDADEGRSTIAANLALIFARGGKRVLLIEADTGEPSLAKLLGIGAEELTVSLEDFLKSNKKLELPSLDGAQGLKLLICRERVQNGFDLLSSIRMQQFMEEAKREYDCIIIDTPPVAVSNITEYFAEMSDAAVMVVRQGFATARRIRAALETLGANTNMLGYVLNDVTYLPILGGASELNARSGAGSYGKYAAQPHYGVYHEEQDEGERIVDGFSKNYRDGSDGEAEIDLRALAVGTLKAFVRLIWLPVALAIVLSLVFCYGAKRSYVPKYRSAATFSISVVGSGDASLSAYSRTVSRRLATVLPYILNSGILNDMICEELGVKTLPARIDAGVVGEDTALFSIEAVSTSAEDAYSVINSAIEKYPQITDLVIGNTRMTLLGEPQLAQTPMNTISYSRQIIKAAGIAVLAGLVVSLILAITRRTVGGVEEIRKILNLRCIGTLPFDRSTIANDNRLVTIHGASTSKEFIDAVALIKKRIEKSSAEHGEKVLLFAGSVPGEGKSTVALNTAFALAASGKRVAFIDCDIRKASAVGGLPGIAEKCLVDYLVGDAKMEEIIAPVLEEDDLYAVRGSRRNTNAPELLRSPRMAALIDSVRELADYVVLDAPPSALLADSQIVAEYADAIIYVVCQDYTMRASLISGINNLSNAPARFMGYVLNNAGVSETGHSYGRQSRYSRYGSYGGYGRYGRYGGYGGYGRYGSYGSYGKRGRRTGYGRYGKYGGYGKYGDYGKDREQLGSAEKEQSD